MEGMAKYLGVTKTGYAKNEYGETRPSLKALKQLALEKDLSIDWFLLERGPMFFQEERDRVKALEQNLQNVGEKNKELVTLKNENNTLTSQINALKKDLEKITDLENKNRELEGTLKEKNAELEKNREERETLVQEKDREREAFLLEQKKERELFLQEQKEKENQQREQLAKELREQLIPELTQQLERERLASGGIETRPEVQGLLDHMSRVPLLYHEVLGHYYRFKLDNRELIEGAMSE
jgi:myosin heavy subunit